MRMALPDYILNKFISVSDRAGVSLETTISIALNAFLVVDEELAKGGICEIKKSDGTVLTLDVDNRLYPNSNLKEINADQPIDIRSIRTGTIFIKYNKYYLACSALINGFECICLGDSKDSLISSIEEPNKDAIVYWYNDSLKALKVKDIIVQLEGKKDLKDLYIDWVNGQQIKNSKNTIWRGDIVKEIDGPYYLVMFMTTNVYTCINIGNNRHHLTKHLDYSIENSVRILHDELNNKDRFRRCGSLTLYGNLNDMDKEYDAWRTAEIQKTYPD